MEGTIVSIKHFEIHDGDGIRTTLFMKGCPLKCVWCHNPESISPTIELGYLSDKCVNCFQCTKVCENHKIENNKHIFLREGCSLKGNCVRVCNQEALVFYGKKVDVDALLPELLMDQMFYGDSGGVTVSGGEPFFQPMFLVELLQKLKASNINTAVDTTLYCGKEILEKVIPYVDTFLVDIKAINPLNHLKCTGISNELILQNIKYLDEIGQRMEFRVPIIKGWNENEMESIIDFISSLRHEYPIKLLPYHDYGNSKCYALGEKNIREIEKFSSEEIEKIVSAFKQKCKTVYM